jgi:hypothetical protein
MDFPRESIAFSRYFLYNMQVKTGEGGVPWKRKAVFVNLCG